MQKIFFQTLGTVINICLFKASPAQLPYSKMLVYILFLLVLMSKVWGIYGQGPFRHVPFMQIGLSFLLSSLLLIFILYYLLSQRKQSQRLVKLLMAWFATELVLSVILKLNLSLIALVSPVSSQPVGLELMFFIWNMALKVNIIRQCCETKWASSILLTFGILVLSALPIQLMLAQYFEQI